MKKALARNVTASLMERMRAEILGLPEGTLLGAEEVLLARYDVSRPTLREALSSLVAEGLVTVKRGYGGGYFTCSPSSGIIARMAGLYLTAQHSTLSEAVCASLPLRILVARLAARASTDDGRIELRAAIERDQAVAVYNREDFLISERETLALLARLAGNAVIELFLAILIAQSSRELFADGIYRESAFNERMPRMRQERAQLLRAVDARDEELAELYARRCVRLLVEWMSEDGHDTVVF